MGKITIRGTHFGDPANPLVVCVGIRKKGPITMAPNAAPGLVLGWRIDSGVR